MDGYAAVTAQYDDTAAMIRQEYRDRDGKLTGQSADMRLRNVRTIVLDDRSSSDSATLMARRSEPRGLGRLEGGL